MHGQNIDEPLATEIRRGWIYYHADGLGSITALTSHMGNIVQKYEYDSFGNMKITPRWIKQPYTYTGREFDPETGLYYYRARYYDAKAGRFITRDPIGFRGGINQYVYVGNNPVGYTDPFGLFSWGDVPKAWDHYCDGSETPWTTGFNSINWGDINSRISSELKKIVGSGTCHASTIPININVEALAAGADKLIIFRHTVNVTGQLKINCDCSWQFSGIMSSYLGYDPYNFNPSNRGLLGEASTFIGRNRCPNTRKTFNIFITGHAPIYLSGQ